MCLRLGKIPSMNAAVGAAASSRQLWPAAGRAYASTRASWSWRCRWQPGTPQAPGGGGLLVVMVRDPLQARDLGVCHQALALQEVVAAIAAGALAARHQSRHRVQRRARRCVHVDDSLPRLGKMSPQLPICLLDPDVHALPGSGGERALRLRLFLQTAGRRDGIDLRRPAERFHDVANGNSVAAGPVFAAGLACAC